MSRYRFAGWRTGREETGRPGAANGAMPASPTTREGEVEITNAVAMIEAVAWTGLAMFLLGLGTLVATRRR